MATLIEAGVPLEQGLRRLAPSLDAEFRPVAEELGRQLEGGRPLSEVGVAWPGLFTPADLRQIEAAERTGALGATLRRIGAEAEAESALRQRLVSRLIYPVVLLHAAAVIPSAVQFVGGEPMRGIIAIFTVLLPCYFVAAMLWTLFRLRGESAAADRISLALPWVGGWLRRRALIRFCRALGPLISAGLRNEEAWEASARATGSPYWTGILLERTHAVGEGESPVEALLRCRFADAETSGLMAAGEATGGIPEACDHAARLAEDLQERRTDRMGVVLPGIVYGFAILLAVIQIFRGLAPVVESYQRALGS